MKVRIPPHSNGIWKRKEEWLHAFIDDLLLALALAHTTDRLPACGLHISMRQCVSVYIDDNHMRRPPYSIHHYVKESNVEKCAIVTCPDMECKPLWQGNGWCGQFEYGHVDQAKNSSLYFDIYRCSSYWLDRTAYTDAHSTLPSDSSCMEWRFP